MRSSRKDDNEEWGTPLEQRKKQKKKIISYPRGRHWLKSEEGKNPAINEDQSTRRKNNADNTNWTREDHSDIKITEVMKNKDTDNEPESWCQEK